MRDYLEIGLRFSLDLARVEDGALQGRSVDWDPILLGPVFELETSPTQVLEVRMRCERTGQAELFWTETLDGKYGGFSQEKYTAFSVAGGDEFRDYRVYPFWHAKKKVIRFLEQKHIKAKYHRIDKDSKNFGRLFVHFKH